MTDPCIDDPCVLFALSREAQAFYREFRPTQRFPGAPCRARFCGPEWLSVLVMETGSGPSRAAEAARWLLSKPSLEQLPYHPKVVISAGFAGALQETLAVGDVILATEVIDQKGQCRPTTWPGELPAGEWKPPLHRGRILSSEQIVGKSDEKKALGQFHSAAAVDMESAAIARLCSQHDVPFGCVRVISDDARTSLPPSLISLFGAGDLSLGRLGRTLVASPGLIPQLWQLARATSRASVQLQKALGELLTLTLPWGREL